jgi:hypothetical protein
MSVIVYVLIYIEFVENVESILVCDIYEYGENLCGVRLQTCALKEIICALTFFCVVPTPWSPEASGSEYIFISANFGTYGRLPS